MVSGPRGRSPQFLRRVHNRPAVRRRSSLAVLLRLLLVAAGLGIGGVGAWAAWTQVVDSPAFRLSSLDLQQVPDRLRSAVGATLAPARGHNLVMLDLDRLRGWVENIPQVDSAVLRRQLPDTLTVKVRQRAAWGTLRTTDGLWSIDREGIVLRRLERPDPGLPVLHLPARLGPRLSPAWRVPSELPGAGRLPDAVRIAEWLRAERPPGLSDAVELRLSPGGVVLVFDRPHREIVMGTDDRLAAKAAALRALRATRGTMVATRVDLRYRDMVVVGSLESDRTRQE